VADSNDLELLSVLMMDIRAAWESMRRSVTNAQSSIEQFRHTRDKAQLDDISNCLQQITAGCAAITESFTETKKPIAGLETTRPKGTKYVDRRKRPR
jgi:hypothetical protein